MRISTLLLASAIALATAPVALAQPLAGALGKPLASSDLDPGTISVRIVAGKPSAPVMGTEVTLVVNGTPRTARTDAAGRAAFAGVPIGAEVQAKAFDDDKKEITSDKFSVPSSGGSRVMLTTKPWQPGGNMGGGGGTSGPTEPRKESGSPRLEQTAELGTLTVTATYDDVVTPAGAAADLPVTLVGYKSDDTMSIKVQATNQEGKTQFRSLDRTGNTIYFVLAQLPRNNALDRTYGYPLQMDSRGGVNLILSGEKRDSTAPPADDLPKVQAQTVATEAGKVRIIVNGAPELPAEVTLYDLSTRQPIGKAAITKTAMDGAAVVFQSQFQERKDLPIGFLGVVVHGGEGPDKPLAKQTLEVIPGEGPTDAPAVKTTASEGNGQGVFEGLPPGVKYRLRVKVQGKEHISEAFDLTAMGGALEVLATWGETGRTEAVFDVPHVPGRVLYGETINRQKLYRTVPFQTIPTSGTQLSMFFYPRTLYTFKMGGQVEDQLLGVRGQFQIQNYAWAPYKAPGAGMVIPLPKGARGIFVDEGDQADVAVEAGVGFRILRPIPPGGRKFGGGFSMPIDSSGKITWNLDLPFGTYQSSLRMLKTPGMFVNAPPDAPMHEEPWEGGGEIVQIAPITIAARQSMQMSVIGLPVLPGWRVWAPRILGISVILILVGGITFAMLRRRGAATTTDVAAAATRAAQREKLLGDLVALERVARDKGVDLDDKQKRRKETLITELEALWGDD